MDGSRVTEEQQIDPRLASAAGTGAAGAELEERAVELKQKKKLNPRPEKEEGSHASEGFYAYAASWIFEGLLREPDLWRAAHWWLSPTLTSVLCVNCRWFQDQFERTHSQRPGVTLAEGSCMVGPVRSHPHTHTQHAIRPLNTHTGVSPNHVL